MSVPRPHEKTPPQRPFAVLLAVLILAAVFGLGTSPFSPAPAALVEQLGEIIQKPDFENGTWGAAVYNLRTGELVYDYNGKKNLLPASNMKLFTTATALDALGADYRYRTTLYFYGQSAQPGVLSGDLYIRGSGDPTFGSQLSGQDPLKVWADSLARMGVRQIRGRIVGDDDVFDDQPFPVGWDIDLVQTESYAAPTGGLAYSDNLVDVYLEGTRSGDSAVVRTDPETLLRVRNGVSTRGGRGRYSFLRVHRELGNNVLSVSGSVPASYRGRVRLPVTNPTEFTLHSFAKRLREAGIQVEADLVDIDELDVDGLPYDEAMPLLTAVSPPLSEIIGLINKKSENFYAEQVFRTFGWGGSAEGAEKRVKSFLSEAGVETQGLALRDGSGLSRKNLVTAQSLAGLLAAMTKHPEREVFFRSLAGGGEAGTTLRYRLGGVELRAKTGSLDHVRALSGYVTARDGTPLAFAVVSNNYAVPSVRISHAQNEFVQALASASY